jgi:murein L,D-transpeptidase YafK
MSSVGKSSAAYLALVLLLFCSPSPCCSNERTSEPAGKVDRIVVVKSARTLTLMADGKVVKTYKVALSREPVGAKERAGDHKVPEGHYVVDSKVPHSRFHLALHISYPNPVDRERARKLGVKPGGNIEIHGLDSKYAWVGSLQGYVDWTDGCIAVTNPEIEEIYKLVAVGTPVEILAEPEADDHAATVDSSRRAGPQPATGVNNATRGAATEFVSRATGKFIVVDNTTGQVLQVSGAGYLPNYLVG